VIPTVAERNNVGINVESRPANPLSWAHYVRTDTGCDEPWAHLPLAYNLRLVAKAQNTNLPMA